MRLWVLSDLHLEQSTWDLPERRPEYDVLVAAGDIHRATAAVRWLSDRAGAKPVVYITGNHEWYSPRADFTIEDELAEARELARGTQVNLLHNQELIIEGVRFLGTPLWTDFELTGDPARSMTFARQWMNDYSLIYSRVHSVLEPTETRAWHAHSRAWLAERLGERHPDARRTVVVTHHLPHRSSIHPRYVGDPLTPAFCSDLSSLVEGGTVDLWIHGHTHSSCDYLANSCRVLCNPKGCGPVSGRLRMENAAFDPELVIDI
ncbi:metallophosphoesterase [Sphingosinicella sp. BN140058]|uniref:metallophosphoesterase n=1 Tax=Sphingosinicella sp. BN140058 TaxID=1892855 RepID=UPI0010101F0C|nr:metallophosphoesterase [Sphingosinicella sp. BN140058]QAY78903.1 metallophosphoesterase [Sphingosinicella sp. BN140058]